MRPRLRLVHATAELLDAAIADSAKLGRMLAAAVAEDWAGFPEALPVLRDFARVAGPGASWGSLLLVLPDPPTLVGLGGYKGPPSADGVVEIGYAIAPAFRCRGFATEAAGEMVERALTHAPVRAVDAHTLAGESPSTRVLRKLDFERIGEVDDPDEGPLWHWRLPRVRRGVP